MDTLFTDWIVAAAQGIWAAVVYVWPYVYQVGEWFISFIIIKAIIAHWLADQTTKLFKKIMIQTRRQAILWVHFRERAMNKGHQYDSPETCQDGVCRTYSKMTLPNIPN